MWKSLVCTLILTEALLASSQSASVPDSCLSGECDHQDDTTMLQKKQEHQKEAKMVQEHQKEEKMVVNATTLKEFKVEVKPYMKQDTQSAFQTKIIVDQGKASKSNADNIVVEHDVSGGDEKDVSGGVSGGDDDFEAAKKRLINTCDQIEKHSEKITKDLAEAQTAWDNKKLNNSWVLRDLLSKDHAFNYPISGCKSTCTHDLHVPKAPNGKTPPMPSAYINKVIDGLFDQCLNRVVERKGWGQGGFD
mmetsp:Transcript_17874/g.31125  ORF Transcript_17874/g.31125 Transcript_17874/m.31125 type:complete len:248 (-) Transcript_17874:91-834(-)